MKGCARAAPSRGEAGVSIFSPSLAKSEEGGGEAIRRNGDEVSYIFAAPEFERNGSARRACIIGAYIDRRGHGRHYSNPPRPKFPPGAAADEY